MSLEKIGELAIELHAATLDRKTAKYNLSDRYTEFVDRKYGEHSEKIITKGHELYAEMQAFSDEEVKAYRRAQLNEYNLKRKLDRAIRRVRGLS